MNQSLNRRPKPGRAHVPGFAAREDRGGASPAAELKPAGFTGSPTDSALQSLRHYIAARLQPSSLLPDVHVLAEATGLLPIQVTRALAQLNTLGEIYCPNRASRQRRVLAPDEIHPDDTAVIHTIKDRITSGSYQPGQALPTTLLAQRHGLTSTQVEVRACRALVAEGIVHRAEGPFGPGIYVSPLPPSPARGGSKLPGNITPRRTKA